jgi:hypothetical protein
MTMPNNDWRERFNLDDKVFALKELMQKDREDMLKEYEEGK